MTKPDRDLAGYTTTELEALLLATSRMSTYRAVRAELDRRYAAAASEAQLDRDRPGPA